MTEANNFSFILNNVETNYINSNVTQNAYQRISHLNLNFL